MNPGQCPFQPLTASGWPFQLPFRCKRRPDDPRNPPAYETSVDGEVGCGVPLEGNALAALLVIARE